MHEHGVVPCLVKYQCIYIDAILYPIGSCAHAATSPQGADQKDGHQSRSIELLVVEDGNLPQEVSYTGPRNKTNAKQMYKRTAITTN